LTTLLLFDIDGTLLRAENATRMAINETFKIDFQAKDAIEDISFLGRTDPELFREAALRLLGRSFKDGEYDAFVRGYLERLPVQLKQCNFYLMPGVAALLPHLAKHKGILMGLETGNIKPAAYLKLKQGGIDGFFSFGGFGSDSFEREGLVRAGVDRGCTLNGGAIPQENIYVIGDSPHDISAGKNLGLNTIAVGTGQVDQEKMRATQPSHYLKDLNDMAAFLRCIGM
jgi:phosphoglycolate phosphatase